MLLGGDWFRPVAAPWGSPFKNVVTLLDQLHRDLQGEAGLLSVFLSQLRCDRLFAQAGKRSGTTT